ncbi:MAG: hypothetical protein IJ861_01570 [Clostridia bacterium]|nr:hypothetical protein [Clostridia bacterium]
MKPIDLLNSIGEVDDELIVNAKKNQKSCKKMIFFIAAAAACVVMTVSVTAVFKTAVFRTDTESIINEDTKAPSGVLESFTGESTKADDDTKGIDESEFETGQATELHWPDDIEIKEVWLYLDDLGEVSDKLEYIELSDQSGLDQWEKENNIEDNTEYLCVKMFRDRDRKDAVLEARMIVDHTHKFCSIGCVNLTDTSAETLLNMTHSDLLFKTLKNTMEEYIKLKDNDYVITFYGGGD